MSLSRPTPPAASYIPGVTFDQGHALANRIHSTGQAIVWDGALETAELYWSSWRARG